MAPAAWPYRRVLAAACAQALRRWLGRWAVFGAVAALVASAGAGLDSALATLAALAAWAALPLARGVAAGGAWAALAVLGVAAVGLALLAAMLPLLWPARWREPERALPIPAQETLRADLPWIALATAPWAALQAGGIAVWLGQQPAWLAGRGLALVLAGGVGIALVLAGGVGLQRLRRQGAWPGAWRANPGPQRAPRLQKWGNAHRPARLSPWRPLIAWPMRRGVAPRLARHTGLTLAAATLLLMALAWRPDWTPWWLALQSLVAMAAVSRARVLAAQELHPLLDACAALPLPVRGWAARIDAVAAAPAMAGVALLVATAWALAPGARMAVLGAWALWLALAAVLELRVRVADASVQSARWLFLLAVALALASEGLAG